MSLSYRGTLTGFYMRGTFVVKGLKRTFTGFIAFS